MSSTSEHQSTNAQPPKQPQKRWRLALIYTIVSVFIFLAASALYMGPSMLAFTYGMYGESVVPQRFMPIALGMANALDREGEAGWSRLLETGCKRPLTRFHAYGNWALQDVPTDYKPSYLECE